MKVSLPFASEEVEIKLFLDALYQLCGYDLRDYNYASIARLIQALVRKNGLHCVSELIPLLAHDQYTRNSIIDDLTVNYSYMFRDPDMFARVRSDIFSYFQSFPRLTIWVAGCASGEEAYSLAILLEEADLLSRTQLYATDINDVALERAVLGQLQNPIDQSIVARYQMAQGSKNLRDYFEKNKDGLYLRKEILQKINFDKHDLVQQKGYILAHMILCRNVLIYFDRPLKSQVLSSLTKSLTTDGYLVIGKEDDISTCNPYSDFSLVSRKTGIYRKKSASH